LVPVLVSQGVSAGTAPVIAGVAGIGSLVGRLCGGYLLDRFDGRIVAAVSVMGPPLAGALLLIAPGSVPVGFAAVFILGVGAGTEYDCIAYLATRYFGVLNFGALFGLISGLLMLVNGIGPFLANNVYDAMGTYDPVMWVLIIGGFVSAGIFLVLGPY